MRTTNTMKKAKTVVAFLPANGDRYLTTPGFIKAKEQQ